MKLSFLLNSQYGRFNKEADGRYSGHMLYIGSMRADGKIKVTHQFGSGRRINQIMTPADIEAEITRIQSL
jgi:hypothetical protein